MLALARNETDKFKDENRKLTTRITELEEEVKKLSDKLQYKENLLVII